MTRWEYCEVHWHTQGVTTTKANPSGQHSVQQAGAAEWHNVLAKLGAEGWELVSVLPDYYYYFKRPLKG